MLGIISENMAEDLLDVAIDLVAETTGHFLVGIGVYSEKEQIKDLIIKEIIKIILFQFQDNTLS